MILVKLFWVFLKVGMFSIGGAYSFLPFLEKELVERYAWLTRAEFLEALGIVKVFPGAISIKYATYTGYKLAGIAGFIAANLGNLVPPAGFILVFAFLYRGYRDIPWVKATSEMVQVAVAALILAVAIRLIDWGGLVKLDNLFIFLAVFLLYFLWKIHPAILIILVALAGIIFSKK